MSDDITKHLASIVRQVCAAEDYPKEVNFDQIRASAMRIKLDHDKLRARLAAAEKENERLNRGWKEANLRVFRRDQALAAAEKVVEVLKRSTTDSCVTGGENGGPGCFYCDTEEGHLPDCEAYAALAEFREATAPDEDSA